MLLDSSFLTQSFAVGLFTLFPFKHRNIISSTAEQYFLVLILSDYLKQPPSSQEPLSPPHQKTVVVCQPRQKDSRRIAEMLPLPEPKLKIIIMLVPWKWNIIIGRN